MKILKRIRSSLKRQDAEERLYRKWQKAIVKEEKKILKQMRENRKKLVAAILMLHGWFILEDADGKEYTEERLLSLDEDTLIDIFEQYLEEAKKDVGEV